MESDKIDNLDISQLVISTDVEDMVVENDIEDLNTVDEVDAMTLKAEEMRTSFRKIHIELRMIMKDDYESSKCKNQPYYH